MPFSSLFDFHYPSRTRERKTSNAGQPAQFFLASAMGTQVLRSHHCLRSPFISKTMPGLHQGPPGPRGRKKRRQNGDGGAHAVKFPNLVMGEVTILKRGEDLKMRPAKPDLPVDVHEKKSVLSVEEKKPKVEEKKQKFEHKDTVLCFTERKQIRINEPKSVGAVELVYAGSGFVTSPAPSALPLPAFFTRDCQKSVNNDRATKDLRRLLGLDLIR